MAKAKTIVVGYDDRDPAKRALRYALDEAKRTRARLIVLVVDAMPLNPQGLQNYGTLDDSPPVLQPLDPPDDVQAILEHAREMVKTSGIEAELAWSAGDPSTEIVATARDEQADLVVLGKHHHSGLVKFFSLDTADAVERELPSELVVVD
jgi:nucleotide-binding universal stress UspA family protein